MILLSLCDLVHSFNARDCIHPVQEDGSMAAPLSRLDLASATRSNQAVVTEVNAETYQQKSHQSFETASLQDDQVPSLLQDEHWTPELCSQELSEFADCNESMRILPVFDVALDPSTYSTTTLSFDINSVTNVLPLYNLDTVPPPLQFQFPCFAPLQS